MKSEKIKRPGIASKEPTPSAGDEAERNKVFLPKTITFPAGLIIEEALGLKVNGETTYSFILGLPGGVSPIVLAVPESALRVLSIVPVGANIQ